MKVDRLSRQQVYFEYKFGGKPVRRTVDLSALTEFLTGGRAEVPNLGPKGEAVLFEEFAWNRYVPVDAQHRLKPSSFKREKESLTALARFFNKPLHKITLEDWETYKDRRLPDFDRRAAGRGGSIRQ